MYCSTLDTVWLCRRLYRWTPGGSPHYRVHHRGQGAAGMYNGVQVTPSRCPADTNSLLEGTHHHQAL
jgi:hypothetical protein